MSTSFPLDGMRIRFSGDTNVGMKRDHNEDSLYLPHSERLAIVADGMGGHASGEVASRMAVETIAGFFRETEEEQELTWPFKIDRGNRHDINRMVTAIKLANLKIHQEAQRNPACHGMGTTVVSSLFVDHALVVGHVGDSRLYRLREGLFDQLTEDHSLLNDYIKMKNLSPEEIAAFPHKNVIVRALGMKPSARGRPRPSVRPPGRAGQWQRRSGQRDGHRGPVRTRLTFRGHPPDRDWHRAAPRTCLGDFSRPRVFGATSSGPDMLYNLPSCRSHAWRVGSRGNGTGR
jgi:serine/threonine protein phosphatase PrpC